MSGEMVERIAMAQAGSRWIEFDEEHRSAARDLARAAIEAMREPTQAMIDAVDLSVPTEGMITDIWDTMIAEALR